MDPSHRPPAATTTTTSPHVWALLAVAFVAALSLAGVVGAWVPIATAAAIGSGWIAGAPPHLGSRDAGVLAAAWTVVAGTVYLVVLTQRTPLSDMECQFDCDDAAAFGMVVSGAVVGVVSVVVGAVVSTVRSAIDRLGR